jgi:NarL family two-component system response regulator LiaR
MISVVIVEDHEQYMLSLQSIVLESNDLILHGTFTSGEEALEPLVNLPPDIALVDIQLKGITGIELIKKVRLRSTKTQFLMCTAFQNNENVFEALKAGALGYIVKGSSAAEIHDAILELHSGGSPMTPYIARQVIKLMQPNKVENSFNLTDRELKVLQLLSKGLLYKEISEQLQISTNTVKNHCKNIYKRLHVQNKTEALNKFRPHSF